MGIAVAAGHRAQGQPVPGQEAGDRLALLWHGLFAATLALPTAIAVFAGDLTARERILVIGVAVGFGLWHWLVLARHRQWWERRLVLVGGYWAVACVFTVALVALHQSFSILLYGLYPLMLMTLGWWGLVPVVGVTALVGWAMGGWGSGSALVTNLLATAGLAVLISVFVRAIAQQSEQRREALAALAATQAELATTAREAGVLAERERLARELHDTIAQGFTSVVMQLESAEQALHDRPADAGEHLRMARRTARDSLDEVRRSVRALRPDLLEKAALPTALDRTVRRWSVDTAVAARFRVTGEQVPLHPEIELVLLRTTQEALTNVARHARASRVTVSLSYLGDTVTLDVNDDGTGFDGQSRPRPEGGYGLIGMRERVEAVGGEFTVESEPGQGATIAVAVPT